jgi:integrase
MIRDARLLFERMRSERADELLNAKVFRVNEAQKTINSAARKLGIPRITHHDLRHLFATVDIPTVSRWLGHKDGRTGDKNLRPLAPGTQYRSGP